MIGARQRWPASSWGVPGGGRFKNVSLTSFPVSNPLVSLSEILEGIPNTENVDAEKVTSWLDRLRASGLIVENLRAALAKIYVAEMGIGEEGGNASRATPSPDLVGRVVWARRRSKDMVSTTCLRACVRACISDRSIIPITDTRGLRSGGPQS